MQSASEMISSLRTRSILKRTLIVYLSILGLAAAFGGVLWGKANALTYLKQHGETDEWHLFGHALGSDSAVLRWLPGAWPRSLAINKVPADPARYAAAVRKLPRLDRIMVFVYEPMSSDIFAALGAVPDVRFLDLTSTSVTDSAFESFKQFASVEGLYLDHSTITDASLDHLLRFRAVRSLDLYENRLGDRPLVRLSQLPSLTTLTLDERVSEQTLATLRARRPDLMVSQ